MKTSDRLASELRVAAKASPARKAAIYEALAVRAETGEFDDYGTHHVCGPTALYQELMASGLIAFARRVADGEFDATREESAEWARSQDGQDAAKMLSPELRKFLGLDLLN